MNKVYANIKAIRIAKGLKQEDIAEKIGVASSNYGRVERGLTELTIERLEKLADVFEMSVDAILNYNKEIPQDFKEDAEYYYNQCKKLEKKVVEQKQRIEELETENIEDWSSKNDEVEKLKNEIKNLKDRLKEKDTIIQDKAKMIDVLSNAINILGQKNN